MRDEFELKLLLAPPQAEWLLRSAAVRALSHGARPTAARLTTRYFDTPDHELKARDIALRVREDGERRVQTMKLPAKGGNGLQHYKEIEAEIESTTPDIDAIKPKKMAKMLRKNGVGDALAPVFTTQFTRKILPLHFDGAEIELAVDEGEIASNGHRAPISEMEIELKSGDPSQLFEVALKLHETVPFRLGLATKAARGYALAENNQPKAQRRRPVALDADFTVGEAFEAIARAFIEHVRLNEEPILVARDPEAVHQVRVAIRRFRAAVWVFRNLMDEEVYDRLRNELRWMQGAFGPARDFDVFARQSVGALIAHFPDDQELLQLRRATEQAREAGYEQAIAALENPRWTRFLLRLEVATVNRSWAEDHQKDLKDPAIDLARKALSKRCKQLRKRGGKTCDRTAEELHRVRVAAKKLRYLTEYFGPMFDKDAAKEYSAQLAGIQEVLGVLNDAAVARKLLANVSAPERAKGIVLGWQEGRIVCELEKLGDTWKAFRKAEPFWA
jgi:inorganic triphosphatase YgiF